MVELARAVETLARAAAEASISMVGVGGGGVPWLSGRGTMRQSASVGWARGGQERRAGGRMRCPG
jgi:hypothetical protein